MLSQLVQGLSEEAAGRLSQMLDEVIHHTRELKDSVMSMRAQPVGSVFQRMPRLVRELSAKTGKKVRLEMVGENTEVDRTIIERLSDPLDAHHPQFRRSRHRSCPPTAWRPARARRARSGFPPSIVVDASSSKCSDDGAGINCERVLKKAREKGLIEPMRCSPTTRSAISSFCQASRPRKRFPTFPAAASAWTSSGATSRTWAGASRSSRYAGVA